MKRSNSLSYGRGATTSTSETSPFAPKGDGNLGSANKQCYESDLTTALAPEKGMETIIVSFVRNSFGSAA